ncbi:MAG: TraR/DksA family transcriptional regulator [Actinobacteria bacterium]|nr:TraR/DksA family transcriptional regulator [Actinomycetota bacterium]MBW3646353.1 TraR/DksA family transcriptional regulator [Actinomycetota bacterium]
MSHAQVLLVARDEALAQIEHLTSDLEQMMAASESSNADDEHDPEGATIAFERAQVGALLAQARQRLEDVEHALGLLKNGTYGRCAGCSGPIGAERLAARPAGRTCICCAGRA